MHAATGHQLDSFVTVSSSLEVLMHVVVTGEGVDLGELTHAASPFVAQTYFWSFVFISFFVLMNIFLAIVVVRLFPEQFFRCCCGLC
jgi:hypothetical protein